MQCSWLLLQGLTCLTKTFSGKNIIQTPPAMILQGCLTHMSLTLNLPVMTMSSSSGWYTTSQCWQNDDSVSNLTQHGCKQDGPYPAGWPWVSSICGNDVIKWHDIPSRRRHEWKKGRWGLRQHWPLVSHKSAGLTGGNSFQTLPSGGVTEKGPR